MANCTAWHSSPLAAPGTLSRCLETIKIQCLKLKKFKQCLKFKNEVENMEWKILSRCLKKIKMRCLKLKKIKTMSEIEICNGKYGMENIDSMSEKNKVQCL